MRTSNSNWNTQNASAVRSPVYSIEFTGLTPIFVTRDFADYDADDHKPYIASIDFSLPGLDVSNGQLDQGRYSVVLNDVNNEVSSLIFTNSLLGLTVTCKVGFAELNYSDFIVMWQATVLRYRIETVGTWIIEAGNDLKKLQRPSFLRMAKGKLGAALTDTGTSLTIATTADGFIEPTSWLQMSEPGSVYAVQPGFLIGQELITYTGINYTTRVASGLTRGCGNTEKIAHAIDEEIVQVIAFFCDPLRAMLHIMTTTNATSTGSRNGDYDLGAPIIDGSSNRLNDLMLGIDKDLINVAKIERLGWKIFQPTYDFENPNGGLVPSIWVIQSIDNTLRFIEENFLAAFGLILTVGFAGLTQAGTSPADLNNKIDISLLDRVDYDEQTAVFTFNDDNVGALQNLDEVGGAVTWEPREDALLNQILYQYGGNPASNFYRSAMSLSVPDGLTFYQDVPPIKNIKQEGRVYESVLLQPVYRTVNALNWRQMIFFDMPAELAFTTQGNCALVEPGDIVEFDLTQFPNIAASSQTWTNVKGIVVGQTVSVQVDSEAFSYRVVTFDSVGYVYNNLSGFYSINKIPEEDMSRNEATEDADFDGTIELADAYFDNTGADYQTNRTIFFVRITPPGYGAGSDLETLRLGVGVTLSGPSFEFREARYVRFNPQSSDPFVIELDLYHGALRTPLEAKLDFISTTATGSEIPTVELIGVWFCVPLTSLE